MSIGLGLNKINIVLSGGADPIATTPTYARWFALQLSAGATGTVAYFGDLTVTGATDAAFETPKGQLVAITGSAFEDMKVGNQYDLSQFAILGTANDNFYVVYETVVG